MIHIKARSMGAGIVAWIVCAGLGCGKAEYDQLVQNRISDLRSGRAAGPKWQRYTSDRFTFTCDLPAEPAVSPKDTGETQGETIDASVGATAYQVAFVSGTNQQLEEAVATVRKQYETGGYQLEEDQEDANVGGYPAVRVRFLNNDLGYTARVQVFVLSNNRSCAMSVVGSDLNDADVLKFFDSFGEG